MTSTRPVLVRPLILGLIFLHTSAYVLRKRGWDNDFNDALQILQDRGGNDLIFDGEERPEAMWSPKERPGYFYRDYDRAGDQDSADLDAAEDRLLLENYLDQEGEDFGDSPVEEENDFPDDISDIPIGAELSDIPINPSENELEEVPVDNSELESILEPTEDDDAKKKREYSPTSLVKKSPDEMKIMATLTPSEVKNLLEEAEETEESVLSDAVEKIKEEQEEEEEDGKPHGYMTQMEEHITMEPLESVSKDELEDVFDEEPKVKVKGSVSVDAKPIGGSSQEGVDEAGGPWRKLEVPPADEITKENMLDYIAQNDESLVNRKRKRADTSLNDPEVARGYIKAFLELEDNENNNLANALNLATLAQVERTDRYVKREAKFIRKAIKDEERLQQLRKQLKSTEDPPSTEDSVKSEGPQLLKRNGGFKDEVIEDDSNFIEEEPDVAAEEELAEEVEAEEEAEEAEREDRVAAMREALRRKLQEFLLQSDVDSSFGQSAMQWENQPVNFQPEDIDGQDVEDLYLNPFWREIMARYEENEVEKRGGEELDVPEEDMEDVVDDEDIVTEDSPEEEVSDVLETYVNSLSPMQKAELQKEVNEELSEAEEELCPALDLADGCSFAGKMGLRLDGEARDLCNRHQLCYLCGSAHGLGSLQCDSGYMEEADHLCDAEPDSLGCKQDALDFFTLMTQAHTFLGQDDFPEECYSSCTLDYIYGLTKK